MSWCSSGNIAAHPVPRVLPGGGKLFFLSCIVMCAHIHTVHVCFFSVPASSGSPSHWFRLPPVIVLYYNVPPCATCCRVFLTDVKYMIFFSVKFCLCRKSVYLCIRFRERSSAGAKEERSLSIIYIQTRQRSGPPL